jgi:hypothetical protein
MKKYQTLCKGMLWNIYHIIVYSGIVIKLYVFIFVKKTIAKTEKIYLPINFTLNLKTNFLPFYDSFLC